MTDAHAAGFLDALRALADTLTELAVPAMVIGRVAVIARGVPRSTVDKLVASRPRDIDDAEQLLLLYGRTMDLPRARRVLKQFGEALEDETRLATLDQLLTRTKLMP